MVTRKPLFFIHCMGVTPATEKAIGTSLRRTARRGHKSG